MNMSTLINAKSDKIIILTFIRYRHSCINQQDANFNQYSIYSTIIEKINWGFLLVSSNSRASILVLNLLIERNFFYKATLVQTLLVAITFVWGPHSDNAFCITLSLTLFASLLRRCRTRLNLSSSYTYLIHTAHNIINNTSQYWLKYCAN